MAGSLDCRAVPAQPAGVEQELKGVQLAHSCLILVNFIQGDTLLEAVYIFNK